MSNAKGVVQEATFCTRVTFAASGAFLARRPLRVGCGTRGGFVRVGHLKLDIGSRANSTYGWMWETQ